MAGIHDFSARTIDGRDQSLAVYRGQVMLVVNVASRCGFTPQYAGLQALYEQFGPRGLVVLGFPCDQFGQQEPGTEAEIAAFCDTRFGVTFPLFAKVAVNGPEAHPLFAWLRERKRGWLGGAIRWNFTKFLIDRSGTVCQRFAPMTKPERIAPRVAALL